MLRLPPTLAITLLCVIAIAQEKPSAPTSTGEKPRVFITDSESWEVSGSAGGSNGTFASHSSGGARPQTAEIVKTFGERCPDVITNNKQERADYVVVLDHEGGKGYLRHRNKVAVFDRISGDSIVSKSTLSLGGSVQEACEAIQKDWPKHAAQATAVKETASTVAASEPKASEATSASGAKLNVNSSPDGADIEVDGSFVGSTPSVIQLAAGDHSVTVSKSGFKPWSKKIRITGGEIKLSAELEKVDK